MSALAPAPEQDSFWAELRAGWAATRLLVALRWRMVRSRPARLAIACGGIVVFVGILLAINMGYAVQIASQQGDTVSGIYARIWVQSLQVGNMASIGALTVGGAVLVAFFAPFTGTSTLALAPLEDLEALRPPRAHRFFDSMLINAVSGIGIVQLLALTGIAGLLTIDGDRLPALLFTWSLWAFLIVLTTTMGWSLEYVIRRRGRLQRNLVGLAALAVLGFAVAVDRQHGATLFGAADYYTKIVRFGVHGWTVGMAAAIAVVLMAIAAVLVAGVQATRQALRLPAPALRASRHHRAASVRSTRWPAPLLAARLLARTIVRTTECRRPIVAVVVVGLPGIYFIGLDENVQVAVALAVPLTVALAWGVNVFAVLGTGMPWLASQPRIMGSLVRAAVALQFLLTCFLLSLMWVAAELGGKAAAGTGVTMMATGVVSALLVSVASASLSVSRPRRTRLSGRGDSLVPPLTALGYLGWLVVLSGYPMVVLSLPVPPEEMLGILALGVAAAAAWFLAVERHWNSPGVRAAVVATVGAA